jgi:hypothetical protein
MNRIASLLICLFVTAPVAAQNPLVVIIWPGKPADDLGIAGAEMFFELKIKGKPMKSPESRPCG